VGREFLIISTSSQNDITLPQLNASIAGHKSDMAPLHRCKRREVPGNDAYNGYKSHFAKLPRKCCHKIYKLFYALMKTCSNSNIFTIYLYTRWKIVGKNVSFNLKLYKIIKYRHQLVSFNSAIQLDEIDLTWINHIHVQHMDIFLTSVFSSFYRPLCETLLSWHAACNSLLSIILANLL